MIDLDQAEARAAMCSNVSIPGDKWRSLLNEMRQTREERDHYRNELEKEKASHAKTNKLLNQVRLWKDEK